MAFVWLIVSLLVAGLHPSQAQCPQPEPIYGEKANDWLVGIGDTARVYAMSGITGDTLFVYYDAFASSAGFGERMAAAGDVNNDGYDDVIIGAPSYDGDGDGTKTARASIPMRTLNPDSGLGSLWPGVAI